MIAIIEQLLLVAILAVAGTGLALAIRSRRKTASRLEALSDTVSILVKTSYQNSKQLRDSGDLLRNVHTTGLEALAFQRKAHDHQRVLMASLNRQATQISQMLGVPETGQGTSGGQKQPATPQAAKLPRRAGFRMAPVIGNGQAQRVGTVPLASLLAQPAPQAGINAQPVRRDAKVVAVEQLFGAASNAEQRDTANGIDAAAEAAADALAADALAAELLGETDMNQMRTQKVANG